MSRLRIAATLALVSLLGACGQSDVITPVGEASIHARVEALGGPPVLVDATTALYVTYGYSGGSSAPEPSTHVVNLTNGIGRTLEFDSDDCRAPTLYEVTGFVDGDLVGIAGCEGATTETLVRIDPVASKLSHLAALPSLQALSPPSRDDTGVLVFRDPDIGAVACPALRMYDAGSWIPVGPLTPTGKSTWDVERLLGGPLGCARHGYVPGIAVSGTKAFVVAGQSDSVCRSGPPPERPGGGCGVYEVDLSARTVSELATGFDKVYSIGAAGPRGVLLAAHLGNRTGLWLVGGPDRTVEFLESGQFSSFSVTPGGEVVAAVSDNDDEIRIVKITLP
ncbi:hypothetical protein [Catellatospora tritici]|uniref:hypothetical protein n=1 Tax=Catellatospora tritici TaxID=2851566 RepID=UPI001C2D9673|nr:hypothetical protein [Catellatospora tritici]MBV1854692.1 hypothetical protein [Catellatospora tritici]